MTLQTSGPMSIDDINVELGRAAGTELNFEDQEVLDLIGKSPGDTVLFPQDFFGASAIFSSTFTAASHVLGSEIGTRGAMTKQVIWINNYPYQIAGLVTQPYSSADLKLTLSYDVPGYPRSPVLTGTELVLNVLNYNFQTITVGHGGGASGINWVWESNQTDFVVGNQYTFTIETAGASLGDELTITAADIYGGLIFGYYFASNASGNPGGSVSPTYLSGIRIGEIAVNSSNGALIFSLVGDHPEDVFNTITFKSNQSGNPDVTLNFLTDNTYYMNTGTHTQWNFPGSMTWVAGGTYTVRVD